MSARMRWWRRKRAVTASGAEGPEPQKMPSSAVEAASPFGGTQPSGAMPRATTILLTLAGGTVAAYGLWGLQGFAAPVLLALVLTICVYPLRHRLERWGVKRGIATGVVIAAVFVLLAVFVGALIVALSQFAALLPQFAPQLQALGAEIADGLVKLGFGAEQVQVIVQSFDPTKLISFVSGLLGSVANITFGLVVILTCLILMAVDASAMPAIMRQLRGGRPHLVDAFHGFAVGVRRYMLATTALGIVQGVLNWIALVLLAVPGAFLWGLLAFLCSFIPNVGYFIAIIPPLVFGLLTGGWPVLIAVIVVYGVINAVVQSIVQPRVVGNAVALSQTITFVSVLFWAVVIGPIGAILAIPLTLLVRTILIDSDPQARHWRAAIGDLSEVRGEMKAEDLQARERRHQNKAKAAGDPDATR